MSIAFDCIPHDLLVDNLQAIAFDNLSIDVVTFLYSYLKRKKKGVKINNSENLFEIFLFDVKGSVSGYILFNMFSMDWLILINEAKFANFADENTAYAGTKDIKTL